MSHLSSHSRDPGQGSGSTQINWNFIWSLNIPPKIRMFLWRASLETLPHKAELCRRKVISSPFCARCPKSVETSLHIFQECRGMMEVWPTAPFLMQNIEGGGSFWAWLEFLKKKLDNKTFLLAVTIMWKAWEIRNNESHGTSFDPPSDIVEWSRAYIVRFWNSQTPPIVKSPRPVMVSWSPPPTDFTKVNTDASFPNGKTDSWMSLVARNSSGECVW